MLKYVCDICKKDINQDNKVKVSIIEKESYGRHIADYHVHPICVKAIYEILGVHDEEPK